MAKKIVISYEDGEKCFKANEKTLIAQGKPDDIYQKCMECNHKCIYWKVNEDEFREANAMLCEKYC